MQDARVAIAMIRHSKQARQLQAERDAHESTRAHHFDALRVSLYLRCKVDKLRGVISNLTAGQHPPIGMDEYSPELEKLEQK
jgi:hypothetical protein